MGQLLQVLLDISCGSGLFSRRFAASHRFSGVIAADYSESMLRQVQQNFESSGYVNDGCASLTCRSITDIAVGVPVSKTEMLHRVKELLKFVRRQSCCCRNTNICFGYGVRVV